jgi:hypothetical protein
MKTKSSKPNIARSFCCNNTCTHNDGRSSFWKRSCSMPKRRKGVLRVVKLYKFQEKIKATCVLVCLLHSTAETLVVSSLYSLFCLIIDSSVCVFPYSYFSSAVGSFSGPRLLRVTDGLEKRHRRESSQPAGKGRD